MSAWKRWAPLALIAVGVGLVIAMGWHRYLSLEALRDNRTALLAFVSANPWAAGGIYFLVYVAAALLAVPGVLWLTIAGGFLFGTWLGGGLALFGALIGATLLFFAARGALAPLIERQAKGWLPRLKAGFQDNAFSYLLSLRFIPLAPFVVVNLAAAAFDMKARDFVLASLLGMAPGAVIYASIGSGLGAVLDAGGKPDISLFANPAVYGPILALAALSLSPVVYKAIKARGAQTKDQSL
jgi:uncharacterized membrane protein YdjX (TVP38/TMEM64 family)